MPFIAAIPIGYIAAAAAVAGIASAGVAAVGAEQSAAAQKKAAEYQAQVAANNAITAEQNAEYATKAGQAKAESASLQSREELGRVVAGEAAQGVDVTTGSAADVQTGQREIGTLNTQNVVNNAALQAYGYRTQATNFEAQSGLLTQEASQAGTAGNIAAAGDLLSGVSSLGKAWTSFGGTAAPGTGGGLTPGYSAGNNFVD
jgi:hypothetical protein